MKSFEELKAEAQDETEEGYQPGDVCPEHESCDLRLREHEFPFKPRFNTLPAIHSAETYCLHHGIVGRR